jgi:hypothetical protein
VNAEADTALVDVGLTTTVTGRIDAAVSTRSTPAQVQAELVTYNAAKPGAAMTLTSAYDAAKVAASQASVNAVDDFVDTEVNAIKAVTDKLDTALELDGAVYRYTANALEQAPVAGGGDAQQATLLAVKAKTDALPTDPADASDIAASFVTTDGKIDAVAAKTNNLPADPADASDIAASFTTVNGKLDAKLDVAVSTRSTYAGTDTPGTSTLLSRVPTIVASQASVDVLDDYVDSEVSAIKAKTDQLTFTGGKVDANATTAIVAGDITAIAKEILKVDWTTVSGEAAYSTLNALRMLRNVWNTTGGTLSVKKEDGSTTAWSRTLAIDPTAQPIVGAS